MSVYAARVYVMLKNKLRRRNVTVLAPEAFMRPLQQITSAAPEASALLRGEPPSPFMLRGLSYAAV